MEEFKTCTKCKRLLALSGFYVQRNAPDGLKAECSGCSKERARNYYRQNREKRRQYAQEYRIANHDKVIMATHKWRKDNLQKTRDYSQSWRKNNPEKYKSLKRKWSKNNPEKIRKSHRSRFQRLTDGMVTQQITRETTLKATDIPQEFIKLKRAQLLLTRELRRRKK